MRIHIFTIKIFIILFFLYIHTEGVLAQQEGNMTFFMYNPWAVNPAAAGYKDVPTLLLHHRTQWLGFKGSPVQQYLNVNTPAAKSLRLGVGFTLSNRKIGFLESQIGTLALSYSVIKTSDFAVRIGLQGSLQRFTSRFDQADDIAILQADRSIPPRLSTRYFQNFGMGTMITLGESYLGFSVPFYLYNVIGINPYSVVTAVEYPHFYLMGGLSFIVSEGIVMKPQAMIKYVKNAPWSFDANLSMVVKDQVTIGVSYRAGKTTIAEVGESASFMTLMQISDRVSIGGAYDWILSPIGQFSYGSFEALVRYDLKKKEIKLSNPRGY